jgi:hypothetical protein
MNELNPYKPSTNETRAFLLGMYLLDWQLDYTGFVYYGDGNNHFVQYLDLFFEHKIIFSEFDKNNYYGALKKIESEFLKRNENKLALAFRSGWSAMLLFEIATLPSPMENPEIWNLCQLVGVDDEIIEDVKEAIQDNGNIVNEFWGIWQSIIVRNVKTKGYIFLCHASEDKEKARELQRKLHSYGFRTWIDEDDILPGKDWDNEIRNALRSADIVLVLLSNSTSKKRGYVQKEIKFALDIINEIPEGEIYIIPALLEDCEIPERLAKYQAVKVFREKGLHLLIAALNYQIRGLRNET